MKYVLDSSVAFKWAVVEAPTDRARELRDDYCNGSHDLIAPDFLPSKSPMRWPRRSAKAGFLHRRAASCGRTS